MPLFIEIRTLTLKPNTRDMFHHHYMEHVLPLLKRWNFDVVTHGPSRQGENTYYVIRRFESLGQREEIEAAFYNSDDWRLGPREAVMALIESNVDVVLEVDESTVEGIRRKATSA
jgi:hypothetical protein